MADNLANLPPSARVDFLHECYLRNYNQERVMKLNLKSKFSLSRPFTPTEGFLCEQFLLDQQISHNYDLLVLFLKKVITNCSRFCYGFLLVFFNLCLSEPVAQFFSKCKYPHDLNRSLIVKIISALQAMKSS